MTGAEMIAAERERQVSAEGWTPEHDDRHDDRSLAGAARCYIDPGDPVVRNTARGSYVVPRDWPWEPEAWKPTYRVRDLVKAGALIAAEIDRLQRAKAAALPGDGSNPCVCMTDRFAPGVAHCTRCGGSGIALPGTQVDG